MIYLLIWSQILFSIIGISLIIYSVWEYFFQPKSSFFTSKRIIEYLDESERRKYQKALAIPTAIIGIVIVIIVIFFIGNATRIFWGFYVVWLVWTMIINKIHLGYFSAWNVPKKIF